MNVLVTGGAGFIGSHLVDALVADGHAVRVLDDLSTGAADQVNPAADLTEGTITDEDLVTELTRGCGIVFHQAALGSVRRSVDSPLPTDRVNVHGTLTVLESARREGVQRVVLASSSSVYGGVAPLPTREDHPSAPRSPYAVTKLTGEMYAGVYHELMGVETVVLRYFNVYGPRQRADSAYAAVIPLFIDALSRGDRPMVHGDGKQSRDFTYVADVIKANLRAAAAPAERCSGGVYNVAGGGHHTVLELLDAVARIMEVEVDPRFGEPRPGDVRESHADLTRTREHLDYEPTISFEEGLRRTIAAFTDR